IVVGDDVFSAGFDGRIHQRSFIDTGGEQHLAAVLELEGHATVSAHIAAVLGEGVAHFSHSAGLVVGQAINHHRSAANAITFVANLDVINAFELAGALLDGGVDLV